MMKGYDQEGAPGGGLGGQPSSISGLVVARIQTIYNELIHLFCVFLCICFYCQKQVVLASISERLM